MNAQTVAAGARALWRYPSAIIFGAIVGLSTVLWWPLIVDVAEVAADSAFPVIRASSSIVSRTPDEVVVDVTIVKQRDCAFNNLQAYSRFADGLLRSASAERIDMHAAPGRISRPSGATYAAGRWRVWPTAGAAGVVMFTQHDCGDGRLVTSTFADVRF
jgi:hypothetical protein